MANELVSINKVQHSIGGCCGSDGEAYYPYGTSITIEDELVEKLGITEMEPGSFVEIRAYAVVESTSKDVNKSGSSRRICMQMTDISVAPKSNNQDYASVLYSEKL